MSKFEKRNPHNKRSLALICAVVIGLALFAVLCIHIQNGQPDENDSALNIPEVSFNGSLDYKPFDSDTAIMIEAVTGFEFKSGTLSQSVNIHNLEVNTYDIVICLYLSDGTLLYESNYLSPGDSLSDIQISNPLEAGIYKNSVIVYRICTSDNTHSVVSQCEFPIEIRCTN